MKKNVDKKKVDELERWVLGILILFESPKSTKGLCVQLCKKAPSAGREGEGGRAKWGGQTRRRRKWPLTHTHAEYRGRRGEIARPKKKHTEEPFPSLKRGFYRERRVCSKLNPPLHRGRRRKQEKKSLFQLMTHLL